MENFNVIICLNLLVSNSFVKGLYISSEPKFTEGHV